MLRGIANMIHEESPQDGQSGQSFMSPFIPVLLVSVAMIILLGYQLTIIFGQRSGLQKQIAQQTEVVTRAVQTQNELQRVVMELLALSETDADAKAIITKYKIASSTPPSAPAATPAK